MKKLVTDGRLAALIITVALIIDQLIKLAVKLNMRLHESIRVTDWFYLYFTENNGMAFGMEIFGKLFLTCFRIVAVAAIIYYLIKISGKGFPKGYIVCIALIVAGAAGNIFDSIFYGEVLSESTYASIAKWVPWGEGYGTLFHGKVVDMFYFPLVEFDWPAWMPWIGGNHFIFFSPIFNFADSCISCGVIAIILFYGRILNGGTQKPDRVHEKKGK